ncbi:IDEAL domain-containing protein [Aciduricibacillus chroicocephali]|uniref:IDEAL domain-containing protein n=1 Tax=Aciduricibacillus chroicocephali TaxID=3054939 RepID=A0ABY9KXJ1_9BACI|nr:IDEAL domain-containing protein [Bacillaceae bacterium 44XB]
MKKQLTSYQLVCYVGEPLKAIREIPFEMKLTARLILDELCQSWNKARLEGMIDEALISGDRDSFMELSEKYREYK